jgi:hypothetical protein
LFYTIFRRCCQCGSHSNIRGKRFRLQMKFGQRNIAATSGLYFPGAS